jgi:hypothetical protein
VVIQKSRDVDSFGINLSGSAAFTSASSYYCAVTYATAQPSNAYAVTYNTGARFTVNSADSGFAVRFVCAGN